MRARTSETLSCCSGGHGECRLSRDGRLSDWKAIVRSCTRKTLESSWLSSHLSAQSLADAVHVTRFKGVPNPPSPLLEPLPATARGAT
jgi:hypothetical protein